MLIPPAMEQCNEPGTGVRSNNISRQKALVAEVIVPVPLAFHFVDAKYGSEIACQQWARPFACSSVVVHLSSVRSRSGAFQGFKQLDALEQTVCVCRRFEVGNAGSYGSKSHLELRVSSGQETGIQRKQITTAERKEGRKRIVLF